MSGTLKHRGPDGEGFLLHDGSKVVSAFSKDTPEAIRHSDLPNRPADALDRWKDVPLRFAFGHRRLSIVDTSIAGHQPFTDGDRKLWLIFNGEIYNHPELREELQKKGRTFRTRCDTEVVIQAWLEWGDDCVTRFNGMWALVVYDDRSGEVFASRDRVGVKPFYYTQHDRLFAFASEQKALLQLPWVQTGIRKQAAAEFLTGDLQFLERGEENFFRNIYELQPGCNIRIHPEQGTFRQRSYYVLPVNPETGKFDDRQFENYRKETEQKITESIRLRLRSDVPVGSCLSGGIDSSTVVSIMAHLVSKGEKVNLGGNLKVFTLSFDDPGIDETRWAEQVVKQTGAEWHKVSPTAAEMADDLEELNYAQDIPVCSTGTYGQFRLMRAARDAGIKVILDGQGGDELFGGYLTHALAYWHSMLRKGNWKEFRKETAPGDGTLAHTKQLLKLGMKNRTSRWLPSFVQDALIPRYFPPLQYLNKDLIHTYTASGAMYKETEVSRAAGLNAALAQDFAGPRLKMYLKYEDRSSMWHSIEARTPFADDHLLADYVFSVPGCYKIHEGVYKYLLREAAKNHLPAAIRERKDKLGFVTPIDQWTQGMKDRILDIFDDSLSDYMNVKEIRKSPARFLEVQGHADAVRIFRMISFASWKRKFNV